MKILVVIPARGQSKGIPRKNVCLMNGKPLISYSIDNANMLKDCCDADVVVDTEDEEIAEIAHVYGAEVINRPKYLSTDHITLDPVVFHALQECETNKKIKYDIVITMQATSPTLRGTTLLEAVDYFLKNDVDTLISGVNTPHLAWTTENEKKIPLYAERINRQYLPPYYIETGAFLISKRECVSENSRIGIKTEIYEIPEDESIDIDTGLDWQLCELILKKKKIIIRADGEEKTGLGHIYRCLSLAYHLIGHDILFVTREDRVLGLEKIKDSHFRYKSIKVEDDFFDIVNNEMPDIIINDILDTDAEYIHKLKKVVKRVVNFEDRGSGADYADCVVNALYKDVGNYNRYNGFEYFFIRDEFLEEKPKTFSSEVKNIVVLFGGSDPCNLTQKAYDALTAISETYPQITSHIITGFGYKYKDCVKDNKETRIFVHNDVKRVSKFLRDADLALTSQGRTIYELASMGVPAIVLAQNERETEHTFASVRNGFINLGLGKEQNVETIESTIEWLIRTPNVRKEMHERLLERDFTDGQKRVIKLILGDEND